MTDSPEYKKAVIDWLLTNGECNQMDASTLTALTDLAKRGVDYDASDLPSMQSTATDPGDSFNDATFVKAFSATIVPVGGHGNWRDRYTFFISADDIQDLVLGFVIQGVIAAANTGDTGWKNKVAEQEAQMAAWRAERTARTADDV